MPLFHLWSVFIGARRVRKGRSFLRTDDKLLQIITARFFPNGYTILEARGGWFDPHRRRFLREDSRQIIVTSNSSGAVRAWARTLGAALRQKELLLVQLGTARILKIQVPRR